MMNHVEPRTRLPVPTAARRLIALLFPLLAPLAMICTIRGADPVQAAPVPVVAPLTLTLADCLHLALEKNPRLATQRASLAAAEDGRRALDNLRAPGLLVPELPIRRNRRSWASSPPLPPSIALNERSSTPSAEPTSPWCWPANRRASPVASSSA